MGYGIVGTVFHSILNQMEYHLVQNRKENCHHDHIPFNVKGNGNIFFSKFSIFSQPSSEYSLKSVRLSCVLSRSRIRLNNGPQRNTFQLLVKLTENYSIINFHQVLKSQLSGCFQERKISLLIRNKKYTFHVNTWNLLFTNRLGHF